MGKLAPRPQERGGERPSRKSQAVRHLHSCDDLDLAAAGIPTKLYPEKCRARELGKDLPTPRGNFRFGCWLEKEVQREQKRHYGRDEARTTNPSPALHLDASVRSTNKAPRFPEGALLQRDATRASSLLVSPFSSSRPPLADERTTPSLGLRSVLRGRRGWC